MNQIFKSLVGLLVALAGAASLAADPVYGDPLSGAALYSDVRTYGSFGLHRYGSPGERAAMDWIATSLRGAGLEVSEQALSMPRQFVQDHGRLRLAGRNIDAFAHWWIAPQDLPLELRAPLKPSDESAGALTWVRLPYDRGAYLNQQHRQQIAEAAARKPLAIILTIDNPAEEIFSYNVSQTDEFWPVPVVVVAARHAALLEAAQRSGEMLQLSLRGRYEYNVAGRNIIGRWERGASRTVVLSTPVSSWFTSTCERGPGIANFLALARYATARGLDANFVFVATSGHEIGHGGMEKFIAEAAPKPETVHAWIHLGASNACLAWTRDGEGWSSGGEVDATLRYLAISPALQQVVQASFQGIGAVALVGEQAGIGELRDVKAAGYSRFFGLAGLHRFFHTPLDSTAMTSPEILEPVARAFADALQRLLTPASPP